MGLVLVLVIALASLRAFSGPKTRPAAVAEQTGRLTWIYFVMLIRVFEFDPGDMRPVKLGNSMNYREI